MATSLTTSMPARKLLFVALLLTILITSLVEIFSLRYRPSDLAKHLAASATAARPSWAGASTGAQTSSSAAGVDEEIPNLVHYTWLLRPGAVLALNFQHFISVYSSHIYIQPERIYFHTDATHEEFLAAREHGDVWTRRTLGLPNVVYNHIVAINTTRKGVNIEKFEHKSDFARTAILAEYGGLYQDFDSIPLRDVAPLRKAGFANVLGREDGGGAINGAMLCKPHSALIDLYLEEQHNYFNGDWNLASIVLLGELAFRLQAIPNEVLLLADEAFTPVRWQHGDELWKEEENIPVEDFVDGGPATTSPTNIADLKSDKATAQAWWEARRRRKAEPTTHLVDFSKAYLVHAFFHGGEAQKLNMSAPGEFIMRRKSSYARAVYPAYQHAIDSGIIQPVLS